MLLSNCADVRACAIEIYEAFTNESMPCDEPWPKGRLALFKRLMDGRSALYAAAQHHV